MVTINIIVLIILCIAFVWTFLYCGSREKYVSAVVFKGLASVCFVVAGLLFSTGTNTADSIVAGLITGCIADIVIELKTVFAQKAKVPFLLGCFLFLAGHIMYLAAVLPMASHRLLCAAAAIIVTAPLMVWIFRHITAKSALKIVGIVYIGTVMFLNCTAISNLIKSPSAFACIFTAGTLLFMASDILLVLNTFGTEHSQKIKNTYIGLYYTGQIFIALSLQYLVR